MLFRSCRPSYFQMLMYSGHKCCHGIKFQSIVTPDGLFASMYGPVNGNRYDSFLLSTSDLLDKLQAFMPDIPGTVVFSLYDDQAYTQSINIFEGCKNQLHCSIHALWDSTLSKLMRWCNGDLLVFFLCGFSWIPGLE